MYHIKQYRRKRHSFVYSRSQNWLFADSTKGASSSAAIYSLIETAKANGLNVYAYLEHLLLYMPGSEWQRYPEELYNLMPWSPDV